MREEAEEDLNAAATKVKIQCLNHLDSVKALKLSQEGLDDLVGKMKTMSFHKGETLIALDKHVEGGLLEEATLQKMKFVFWSVSGDAEVLTKPKEGSKDNKEARIRTMMPGSVFGERHLIGDTSPEVWVRAATSMQVFVLEQGDFMDVINRHSVKDPGLTDRHRAVRTDVYAYFSVCLCIYMPRLIDLSLVAGTTKALHGAPGLPLRISWQSRTCGGRRKFSWRSYRPTC